MLRLLSGVDVPWRGLVGGAVVGGIGITLLKVLGTSLIAGTTDNPLFASIALVVGLLAWLNFMSRIILLSAAWSANSLESDAAEHLSEGERAKLVEGPALPVSAALDPAAEDPVWLGRAPGARRARAHTGTVVAHRPRGAPTTGSTSPWARCWALPRPPVLGVGRAAAGPASSAAAEA